MDRRPGVGDLGLDLAGLAGGEGRVHPGPDGGDGSVDVVGVPQDVEPRVQGDFVAETIGTGDRIRRRVSFNDIRLQTISPAR